MLSPTELERYNRQLGIEGIGAEGQEKLKAAEVVVAGVGGLGSASITYLVEAGIGTIRIIDCDRVELSNLNRQILHWPEDIGRRKIDSAMDKLQRLSPEVRLIATDERITESNVRKLLHGAHLVVDAMDNLPTRYLLNQAAQQLRIPFFHGAVSRFEGRVMTVLPGESACLHCLYHGRLLERKTPVIGVTPAIIGNIQVTEVIKYLLGIGELLTDRLLVYDGLRARVNTFHVKKDPSCPHCSPSKPDVQGEVLLK